MTHPTTNQTSQSLTEVRTVLSRAETALDAIVNLSYRGNIIRDELFWKSEFPDREVPHYYPYGPTGEEADPYCEEMYNDLLEVVALLSKWRSRRKRKR